MNVISETQRIEFRYWPGPNGKPIKFAVCFLSLIDGEWTVIRRCDDAHVEKDLRVREGIKGHCHLFQAENGDLVEYEVPLGPGTAAEHLTEVLADFNKNHEEILHQYRQAVEKATRQRKNKQ